MPTLSAATTSEPVNITLFFPAGNEVAEAIRPYFTQVAEASNGLVQVSFIDQALSPEIAEELNIRENGYIVFQGSGDPEKLKMNTDINKGGARSKLKKLDGDVLKRLLKVSRGERIAYVLTGHREANGTDKSFRKISKLKTATAGRLKPRLWCQPRECRRCPGGRGCGSHFDPLDGLTEDETTALKAYADAGEPFHRHHTRWNTADPLLSPWLSENIRYVGGSEAGRRSPHLILTDRYSTHPTVKVLSDAKTVMVLAWSSAFDVASKEKGKHTVLIRTQLHLRGQ